MKGSKPVDECQEATEIIELASEQIESLASAFELIASMLGDAAAEEAESTEGPVQQLGESLLH